MVVSEWPVAASVSKRSAVITVGHLVDSECYVVVSDKSMVVSE